MPLAVQNTALLFTVFYRQLSKLSEPLWTDPDPKSGIGVRELLSASKKKKAHVGNEWSNILPTSSQARKKSPPPPPPT